MGEWFGYGFGLGIFLGWLLWLCYYRIKLETMQEVLANTMAENAKLRVSLAAGATTSEAKLLAVTTQAASMTAFPEKVKAAG